MGEIKLRDATSDDAKFLSWVILAAGRSHLQRSIYEFINGQTEDEILQFLELVCISEIVHWCHYSLFLIAEVDGQPAAALCGFDPEKHGYHTKIPVAAEINRAQGITEDQKRESSERTKIVITVAPEYAPGVWVLDNVATLPAYRRQGLIDALMQAMLERGKSLGFSRAQIGVLIGNEAAMQAYRKNGFNHFSEKRNSDFEAALGSPGIHHLILEKIE